MFVTQNNWKFDYTTLKDATTQIQLSKVSLPSPNYKKHFSLSNQSGQTFEVFQQSTLVSDMLTNKFRMLMLLMANYTYAEHLSIWALVPTQLF